MPYSLSLCLIGLCDQEPTEINNCTLCEDGSPLKQPLQEGLPGKICAGLQVDAQRDDFKNCEAYQATLGVYCQCDNPMASASACRLCSDAELPNPLQILNGTDTSCGELELEANFESACSSVQEMYGEECCRDLTTPAPTTSSATLQRTPWMMASIVIMLCRLHLL